MFASFHVKEGGAPEHAHLLHNRHGPTVAVQKCLTASTKFVDSKQALLLSHSFIF